MRSAYLGALIVAWAVAISTQAREGNTTVIGRDDKTGESIVLQTGKKHPFVAWTPAEIATLKTQLSDTSPASAAVRDGWNRADQHGMLTAARNGQPLACARVWAVTGDRAMAETARKWLVEQVAAFEPKALLDLNPWSAYAFTTERVFAYDLTAESGAVSPEDGVRIQAHLRQILDTLRRHASYGAYQNHGTPIEAAIWATALCLEDADILRDRLDHFKKMTGASLWPGGYWYEGTAYGGMVMGDYRNMVQLARRSGIPLDTVYCQRRPFRPGWTVSPGYVQAAELFSCPQSLITPLKDVPTIGDGGAPGQTGFPDRSPGNTARPETGIFAFRQGSGFEPDDQYVLFLALARTGFHPHSDQGHIDIVRYGKWLTGDLESSSIPPRFRGGYTPLNFLLSSPRWGHNTVVVNGSWGTFDIDFPVTHYASGTNSQAKVNVADVTMTGFCEMPFATQRRRVLVTDEFIVLTDDVAANKAVTYPAREVFLRVADVRDWKGLVAKLAAQSQQNEPTPGKVVWPHLTDGLKDALRAAATEGREPTQDLCFRLLEELNKRVIDNPAVAHADTWWIEPIKHDERLSASGFAMQEVRQLNRHFLENAYPEEIANCASPEVPMDWFFHGVRNAKWTLEEKPGKPTDQVPLYVPQHGDPDHNLVWQERYDTAAPWRGRFLVDEKAQIGLRVWQLDVEGGQYGAAEFTPPRHSPYGLYEGERMPLICQRKRGTEAHFTVLLEPYKGDVRIASAQLVRNAPNDRQINVTFKDGRRQRVTIADGAYRVEDL